MTLSSPTGQKRWLRVDLHIHTPASEDYAEQGVTFLDILHEAERRGLEIIAFTDHNSVAGYERMQREIEFLEQLVQTRRSTPADHQQLDEYYRLLKKITVLPGFEFTSHYGAHVLGIFPPATSISLIEATLLQLGVAADKLKTGSTSVPDTKHVTDAYEIMAKAGALVIAAHVNGAGGVITETLRMGTSGQARIAATQSPHLSALEFINFYTDHGTFTNPAFYNGKTEHYERPMFCIQGSDAHRVRRAPSGTDATHKHGIGDRYFEALLPEPSFTALKALFQSQNFDHVRVPKRDQKQWEIDQLRFGQATERQVLRSEAEPMEQIARDVAALCNMGGGTIIVGAVDNGTGVQGVSRPDQFAAQLRTVVEQQIEPAPGLTLELMRYEGRDVIRIEVSASHLPPYVLRNGVVYVRRDVETVPATRGEIVQLARRALAEGGTSPLDNGQDLELPRSGVEIVDAERRNGEWLYEIRDLRTTPGVSRERAQGLWQYAIARHEDLRDGRVDLYSQVTWAGRLGLLRAYQQGGRTKFDLVHRDANGVIDHIFYGVSDWGLGEAWNMLLADVCPSEQDLASGARRGGDENDLRLLGLKDERVAAPERGLYPRPSRGETVPAPPAVPPVETSFGDRRWRWRGRGGVWRISRAANGAPRFHVAMKHGDGDTFQEYKDVPREKLSEVWLRFIRVPRPRTGIEVIADTAGDDGVRRITFRDLRHGELSAPWRAEELKEGSVREYAARMHMLDAQLDETAVRWWGNLGYLRPMRSQVDLVYRDEEGVDHIYYAARREELRDEWAELLAQWPDEGPFRMDDASGARSLASANHGGRSAAARNGPSGAVTSSPTTPKTGGESSTVVESMVEYVRPWSRAGTRRLMLGDRASDVFQPPAEPAAASVPALNPQSTLQPDMQPISQPIDDPELR